MSSAVEMSALVWEAAETAPTANWKDRVQTASRILRLPFSRAKAFYYREHRVVTAEEMDYAREAVRQLREQRQRAKEQEHLAWIEEQINRHRASGEELRGPHVDALQHILRMARNEAGAVALQQEAAAETVISRAGSFSLPRDH